jgi:hypothetical protein
MKVLKKRLALADELANTPTTTVTLRMPTGLNQWLDAYAHGAWPAKVLKQELVVEALRLLIAHRGGAREELVTTDLLEDSQAEDSRGEGGRPQSWRRRSPGGNNT